MGTLGVVVVAVAMAAIMLLLVLAYLRLRRTRQDADAHTPVHPQAPEYRKEPRHMEYYRPQYAGQEPAAPATTAKHDPRKASLPHCPLCSAAVGFDDKVCPKCKHTLKGV